ncbi:restriction endonuclease subunit S [Clostridium algidicarnis]|uniref:restriction endonuclease subunit S n=1 Tax=Clostridium algidicarnis TaxID=37659 RepID=UPI001624BD52|nr:restriction endonuclease subunit S [Clostridium algidicarnis]MBB6696674.1 restriction endonuclease subunit S [Clostridium algidicarnis]
MAQVIFKQWFVDFEFPNEDGKPYKSSGGEMVESEIGMIPKGWDVVELEKVAQNITRGMTPKYEDNSKVKVLNQKVNKGKILEKQYLKYLKEDLVIPDEKYAYQWDILLNSLGQGTLGRVHLYKEMTTDVVVDQHISIIRCKNPGWAFYVYNLLDSSRYQAILEGLISGSTGMLMLNISKIRNLKIVKPSEELIAKFGEMLIGLYKKIEINNCISEKLVLTRDTLLPKLMSGEINLDKLEINI